VGGGGDELGDLCALALNVGGDTGVEGVGAGGGLLELLLDVVLGLVGVLLDVVPGALDAVAGLAEALVDALANVGKLKGLDVC
jgi:hypothetical protein